jgi:hypothetical protein
MAVTKDDCYIDDDVDTLTVMNEDVEMEASSPNDTRYQRDVSSIPQCSEQRTNPSSNFGT